MILTVTKFVFENAMLQAQDFQDFSTIKLRNDDQQLSRIARINIGKRIF